MADSSRLGMKPTSYLLCGAQQCTVGADDALHDLYIHPKIGTLKGRKDRAAGVDTKRGK
jgi:hypothetical protein